MLGIRGGHCEVRVHRRAGAGRQPARAAGPRLRRSPRSASGPGRIFHCMRWLGPGPAGLRPAVRAAQHPHGVRRAAGRQAADAAARLRELRRDPGLPAAHAARRPAIDRGDQARVEIGAIKVVGARMLHNVIDRAIQAYGAAGLTDDTPLSFMYRRGPLRPDLRRPRRGARRTPWPAASSRSTGATTPSAGSSAHADPGASLESGRREGAGERGRAPRGRRERAMTSAPLAPVTTPEGALRA